MLSDGISGLRISPASNRMGATAENS
ncbi:unnamed protein product, partial [Rotaria socialis]